MKEGNRCELCNTKIQDVKSQFKQTKYCDRCAKEKKIESTKDSIDKAHRRECMRRYMREYRLLHPNLSTPYVQKHRQEKSKLKQKEFNEKTTFNSFIWFLLFLITPEANKIIQEWFSVFESVVTYLDLVLIKLAGLFSVAYVCFKHIKNDVFRENKKTDNSDSKKQKDE